MRILNSLSILMYTYPIYKYQSYRASLILFNGIIYHALLPSNVIMCSIDVFINFLISCYTAYYCPKLFLKGLFCIMLFLINDYLFYTSRIGCNTSQILHILTIHIPFLLMLIIHHKEELKIIQDVLH